MTSIITPELIEKCAEAIELAIWYENSSENMARACLNAALPDVIDACARIPEQMAGQDYHLPSVGLGIAAAIRSLAPKPEGK